MIALARVYCLADISSIAPETIPLTDYIDALARVLSNMPNSKLFFVSQPVRLPSTSLQYERDLSLTHSLAHRLAVFDCMHMVATCKRLERHQRVPVQTQAQHGNLVCLESCCQVRHQNAWVREDCM